MTTLNFALSRTAARDWEEGDEVVVTRLDHDANISPWLELADDKNLTVHFCEIDDECRIDLDHLRSLLSERTKVVAFPWASNAVGTITPVQGDRRARARGGRARLGRRRALRAARRHRGGRGRHATCCSARRTSSSARTSGSPTAGAALLESWRPYKVRPQSDVAGPAARDRDAARTSCSAASSRRVEYLHGVGWKFINEHERKLGQKFLDGLPDGWKLHGPPTMEGRVSTFALSPPDETPAEAATRLGAAGFAVWDGNYYAVEVMKHLGLPDGAIRIGIVHTNMEDEVDRLLAALPRR